MKFYVLASSSSGNASYLEVENRKILIDVGLPYTVIKKRLEIIGVDVKDLTDILITHEHGDHIRGLEVVLKHTKATIHTSKGTYENIKESFNYNEINAFEDFILDTLVVRPLPLSHDAKEPLGFLFLKENKKIAYLTDTGYLYQEVLEEIKDCNLYFLESNHDPHLLTQSKRPYYLISRILNERGHLSNFDAAYYFSQVVGKNTSHLIFAHISQECNKTHLIESTFNDVLMAADKSFKHITFIEALADKPLPVIKI